jgi:hypothetical protein
MLQHSGTRLTRLRKRLVPVAIIVVGLVSAILFNTHVVKTDGPGPIGFGLMIYLILLFSSRRKSTK